MTETGDLCKGLLLDIYKVENDELRRQRDDAFTKIEKLILVRAELVREIGELRTRPHVRVKARYCSCGNLNHGAANFCGRCGRTQKKR